MDGMDYGASNTIAIIIMLTWVLSIAITVALIWAIFNIRSNVKQLRESVQRLEQAVAHRQLP